MKRDKPTIFDEITLAVRGSNDCAARLQQLSEQMNANLYDIESHLRKLLEFPQLFEAPEVEKLLRRIERLRELRNMEELGSFCLTVSRDMEAIWQRIPK